MSIFHKVEVEGVPPGFTEQGFTTGEVTLNYVSGPDNGLPLQLIPGQMESWQGHKPVLSELSQRFQVFVPNLKVVQIPVGHEIHMVQPLRYIVEVETFVDDLKARGKLPA